MKKANGGDELLSDKKTTAEPADQGSNSGARNGEAPSEGAEMATPEGSEPQLYHVHTHLSDLEKGRLIFEIVALSMAAIWAFYVFIYQERIKPAGQPAVVEASAAVSHRVLNPKVEFVNVTVNFHNIGSTSADLAGLAVQVFGYRFLESSTTRTQTYRRLAGDFDVYRTLNTTEPALLHSYYRIWRPFRGKGTHHIDAGGATEQAFWFGVRPGQYDIVTVDFRYCFTKSGDPRTYQATPVHHVANGPYYLPDNFHNDLPNGEKAYRCLLVASGLSSQGFAL